MRSDDSYYTAVSELEHITFAAILRNSLKLEAVEK